MKYTMLVSVSSILASQAVAVAQVPPPIPLVIPPPLPPGPPPIMAPPPPRPGYLLRYDPRHYDWCANRYRTYRGYDDTYQPNEGPRRLCYSPYRLGAGRHRLSRRFVLVDVAEHEFVPQRPKFLAHTYREATI